MRSPNGHLKPYFTIFRFRTTMFGKLVLQKKYVQCKHPCDFGNGWQDANSRDLVEYYRQNPKELE